MYVLRNKPPKSNAVKRGAKRRRCAGTHKWANWPLKIQTGPWPRFWGLLYIGAVLLGTNERVIPPELMRANTQARLQLFYVRVKVSVLLHFGHKRRFYFPKCFFIQLLLWWLPLTVNNYFFRRSYLNLREGVIRILMNFIVEMRYV